MPSIFILVFQDTKRLILLIERYRQVNSARAGFTSITLFSRRVTWILPLEGWMACARGSGIRSAGIWGKIPLDSWCLEVKST